MAYIQVEGLKEFNRAVRQAKNVELNKRLGQANKEIGELVIRRLNPRSDPRAVGAGAGAAVRSSAARREVLLRTGGAHRASGRHTKKQPWGRQRVTPPGKPTPRRPFIQGTAETHFNEIGDAWLDAVFAALGPAFA